MKIKFLALFLGLTLPCLAATHQDYYNHIKSVEGYKNTVYKCSEGYKTIGIGTNLDSRKIKARVGQKFSDSQIQAWAREDIMRAERIAKQVFPSFNKQPKQVQILLVSLSHNLGQGGISKFKDFRKAVEKRDYKKAAAELKDSRWYFQVKGRGAKYVEILNKMG